MTRGSTPNSASPARSERSASTIFKNGWWEEGQKIEKYTILDELSESTCPFYEDANFIPMSVFYVSIDFSCLVTRAGDLNV